jgi:hypothetical protein
VLGQFLNNQNPGQFITAAASIKLGETYPYHAMPLHGVENIPGEFFLEVRLRS